jgi:hypothetical protein
MIEINEYIAGHEASPDWTPERHANAETLLDVCALLEREMASAGVRFPDNPKTGNGIGGQFHGFGGFRPQDCKQGAPHSSHKDGQAVDRYDPDNAIDKWLADDYAAWVIAGDAGRSALVRYGIYIEHPDSTPGWSHWSTKAPASGHHIFLP